MNLSHSEICVLGPTDKNCGETVGETYDSPCFEGLINY